MQIMDTLDATYFLAGLLLLVHLVALLATLYPTVTVFHVSLAVSALTYGVRPILSASEGGLTIYSTRMGWQAYNTGLLLQAVFLVFYLIGYLFVARRGDDARNHGDPVQLNVSLKGLLLTAGVGFGALGVIHVLSNGGWLPTTRGQTLTSAVPYGKILFPMAAVPLTLLLPQAWVYWRTRPRTRWPSAGILAVAALVALVLLYQRAFIVYAAITVLWLINASAKRRVGYVQLALFAFLVVLIVGSLRPVAESLVSGNFPSGLDVASGWPRIKEVLLYQPNFDRADIWPVVLEYVEERGFRAGATYLSVPARFATPAFRERTNMLTAVDELNEYYWGDTYWRTNFGFAIAQSHELFLNFGWAGMVLAIIPGLLTGWIDNRLRTMKYVSAGRIALITGAFLTGGFMGELAGAIQWLIVFVLFASGLHVCERLRIWRPVQS